MAKIKVLQDSCEGLDSELEREEQPIRTLPKKPPHRPKGTKNGEKHVKILTLRARGMTHDQIAVAADTHPTQVWKVLKQWEKRLPDLKCLEGFTQARPSILAGVQAKVLNSISKEETLDRARPGELAKILDVTHKIERLEKGLSTSNRASVNYTKIALPPEG